HIPVGTTESGPRTPTSLPLSYACREKPSVWQGSAALESLLARRLLFPLPPPSVLPTLHAEHGAGRGNGRSLDNRAGARFSHGPGGPRGRAHRRGRASRRWRVPGATAVMSQAALAPARIRAARSFRSSGPRWRAAPLAENTPGQCGTLPGGLELSETGCAAGLRAAGASAFVGSRSNLPRPQV